MNMNKNLTLGEATNKLIYKDKIAYRKGWNGKGMYIFLVTGYEWHISGNNKHHKDIETM